MLSSLTRALALVVLTAAPCLAFVVPSSRSFPLLDTHPRSSVLARHVAASAPQETSTPTNKKLNCDVPPFTNIMAANRAEIAVRIMRAATELNAGTVAIYGHEDRYSQHRWGADRSFLLEKQEGASPISAYLDIEQIIKVAQKANVDAIHPGYGFLSESPQFAQACEGAGITFVGPTVDNLNTFSDKTSARNAAIAAGVPVVPGSDGALTNAEEVLACVEEIGLPVIIKASMGGKSDAAVRCLML